MARVASTTTPAQATGAGTQPARGPADANRPAHRLLPRCEYKSREAPPPPDRGEHRGSARCGRTRHRPGTRSGPTRAATPTASTRRPWPRTAATRLSSSESPPISSATPSSPRGAINGTKSSGDAPPRSRPKQGGSGHASGGASGRPGDHTSARTPATTATTPATTTTTTPQPPRTSWLARCQRYPAAKGPRDSCPRPGRSRPKTGEAPGWPLPGFRQRLQAIAPAPPRLPVPALLGRGVARRVPTAPEPR